MIVLDASVVVDLVLDRRPTADEIRRRIRVEPDVPAAPMLLDVEVGQVLRRFTRSGALAPERASDALDDLTALRVHRYPHLPLLQRAFELRDNATFYDAVYIVLAEALGATLLTADAALGTIPGHRARVEVL